LADEPLEVKIKLNARFKSGITKEEERRRRKQAKC
jgi:hypothetical protein